MNKPSITLATLQKHLVPSRYHLLPTVATILHLIREFYVNMHSYVGLLFFSEIYLDIYLCYWVQQKFVSVHWCANHDEFILFTFEGHWFLSSLGLRWIRALGILVQYICAHRCLLLWWTFGTGLLVHMVCICSVLVDFEKELPIRWGFIRDTKQLCIINNKGLIIVSIDFTQLLKLVEQTIEAAAMMSSVDPPNYSNSARPSAEKKRGKRWLIFIHLESHKKKRLYLFSLYFHNWSHSCSRCFSTSYLIFPLVSNQVVIIPCLVWWLKL